MPGMPLLFMTSLAIASRLAIALSIWPSRIGTPAVWGGDVSAWLGIGASAQRRQKVTRPVVITFLVGRSDAADSSKDMMRHSGVRCCNTWLKERQSSPLPNFCKGNLSLPKRPITADRVQCLKWVQQATLRDRSVLAREADILTNGIKAVAAEPGGADEFADRGVARACGRAWLRSPSFACITRLEATRADG